MQISKELLDAHPGTFAYALHASGLHPAVGSDCGQDLSDAAAQVRGRFLDIGQPTDHPAISVWREAYALAGVKPSKFRSSIEALVRRALKDAVPSVSPLVDLYNAISLRFLVPLGAIDADLVPDEVTLRLCRPESDRFSPLGGQSADFPLKASIPVYAANDDILCWCFNCRDSAPTALRRSTTNTVFFTEGVNETQRPAARAALDALGKALSHTGATVSLQEFARP